MNFSKNYSLFIWTIANPHRTPLLQALFRLPIRLETLISIGDRGLRQRLGRPAVSCSCALRTNRYLSGLCTLQTPVTNAVEDGVPAGDSDRVSVIGLCSSSEVSSLYRIATDWVVFQSEKTYILDPYGLMTGPYDFCSSGRVQVHNSREDPDLAAIAWRHNPARNGTCSVSGSVAYVEIYIFLT